MSLRDDVDSLLPGWESWYPSLFHAAEDLGLIRARVCAPSLLMISQRHAQLYNEAVQAFRKQWSAEESEGQAPVFSFKNPNNRQLSQPQHHADNSHQRLSARDPSVNDEHRDALDHVADDGDLFKSTNDNDESQSDFSGDE